jgi:hypothetical protein
MVAFKDMTGLRFGRLTVIRQDGRTSTKGRLITWLCKCACGKECCAVGDYLRKGYKKSCGCLQEESWYKNHQPYRTSTCIICNKVFRCKCYPPRQTCSQKCLRIKLQRRQSLERRKDIKHHLAYLCYSAKARARKLGVPYNITVSYLLRLHKFQNGKCSVTGKKLEFIDVNKSPWSLSIDRIKPSLGYTKGNITLVCLIHNLAKNKWDQAIVVEYATCLLSRGKNESSRI